ncbi:MAG: FUSC family protein [Pseudomonadota bacterium]
MSVLPDLSRRQTRDAARLAIQSAVAAAAMFTLMKALGLPERFVGVLSAVMVVQPSAGAAIGEAKDRFLATIVGAIIGIICLALLPSGYGTAAALALSMLVMNAIAGFREEWRYGVVAAVALALGSETEILQTAFDRSLAIGAGVVVGAAVTMIVWPDRAEQRAMRHLHSALDACATFLSGSIAQNSGETQDVDAARRSYLTDVGTARDARDAVRFKDTKDLSCRIDAIEKLWTASVFVLRIGEEADPAKTAGLSDRVASIRKGAETAARSLADGQQVDADIMASLEADLDAARTAAIEATDDGTNVDVTARSALVFALGEIVDALSAYDACDGEEAA